MLASVLVVMIFSQLTACLPNGLTTKLRTKSLGWSVIGTIFWSQEKSRIDRSMRESRCAKFHVPSEKQSNTSAFLVVDICLKAHILSHKWETHQCSCKNSKGGLEKSTFCQGFQVLSGVIGTFSTPSTRVPRRQAIPLKGFVTLARHRRSLGKVRLWRTKSRISRCFCVFYFAMEHQTCQAWIFSDIYGVFLHSIFQIKPL